MTFLREEAFWLFMDLLLGIREEFFHLFLCKIGGTRRSEINIVFEASQSLSSNYSS